MEILDLQHKRNANHRSDQLLELLKADIYGITAVTYTRFEAIDAARRLKQSHPDSTVIAGGVHFSSCAEDALAAVSDIDIVVRGEGEVTLCELVKALEEKGDLSRVNGITYRDQGRIVSNADRETFEDLDGLPLYDDYRWDDYPEYLLGVPEQVRATSIMTSRGCPYRCVFCCKAGMKYRLRDPIAVVDEIEGSVPEASSESVQLCGPDLHRQS